jgi:hypothetical protein
MTYSLGAPGRAWDAMTDDRADEDAAAEQEAARREAEEDRAANAAFWRE